MALLKSPGWIVTMWTPNFANSRRSTFFISKFNLIFLEIVSYVTKTLDCLLCGTVHREARVAVESSNTDDNFDQNRLSFSSHLVTLIILPPPIHLIKSSSERMKRLIFQGVWTNGTFFLALHEEKQLTFSKVVRRVLSLDGSQGDSPQPVITDCEK